MIKTYTASDAEAIKAFLRKYTLPEKTVSQAESAVLAYENSEVVGFASCKHHFVHPNRAYLQIFVSPDFRRQGLGSALFEHLRQILADQANFQISIYSDAFATIAFLKNWDFHLVRRCFTPLIRQENLRLFRLGNSDFTRFSNATATQKHAALTLLFKNYQLFHAPINALNSEISLADFQKIVLPDLDAQHSYLKISGEQVVAYVFSYFSEQDMSLEIGYVGGANLDNPDWYLPFYQAVLLDCFCTFEQVALELDDVDTFAMSFAKLIDFPRDFALEAYVWDNKYVCQR